MVRPLSLQLLTIVGAPALAQESYTHPGTGITFFKQVVPDGRTQGGFEWGFALPQTGLGNAVYIGYIVSRRPSVILDVKSD